MAFFGVEYMFEDYIHLRTAEQKEPFEICD
jgi:hypothetical protein